MTINDKEIKLLMSDPSALIVKYQYIIKIIINKFISTGSINPSDREEFIQIVNERLLLSVEKIKKQYKGISLLKTYFSTIIRNICLEEINKRKRYNFVELEKSNDLKLSENTEYDDLNNEFDRLSKILDMYRSKTSKLVLCLKLIYRLPVTMKDFTNYSIKFNTDEINEFINIVNPPEIVPEFKLFQLLTPYINKCDNQNNQPDAIRRWVKRKIDEIIELMNGNPPRASYDKDSLQILVEKYYMKNIKQNVQIK